MCEYVFYPRWCPVTGIGCDIMYISACVHDANQIPTAIPMIFLVQLSRQSVRVVSACFDGEQRTLLSYILAAASGDVFLAHVHRSSVGHSESIPGYRLRSLYDLNSPNIKSLCLLQVIIICILKF